MHMGFNVYKSKDFVSVNKLMLTVQNNNSKFMNKFIIDEGRLKYKSEWL